MQNGLKISASFSLRSHIVPILAPTWRKALAQSAVSGRLSRFSDSV
jgi:hypothetical protein